MRSFRILSCCLTTLCFALPTAAHAQTGNPADAQRSGTDPAAGTTADVKGDAKGDVKLGDLGAGAGTSGSGDAKVDPGGALKPTDPGFDVNGTPGARAIGLAPPGGTGGFMDTRLTWTFGDDDFLHKTGELVPLSPSFNIGERSQYRLFFDNLNSRFTGRENVTHLVMYKKMPAFIDKLTTEAALVVRFDLGALSSNTGNLNQAFYDSGSYIRLFYQTGAGEKEGISAVFLPLDTDRIRLGYLYDISWGGTAGSINQSIFPRVQGTSPGMKLQYDHKSFYVFAGFKTATIVQPQQILKQGSETEVEVVRVGEANYGFLGGAGVDAHEMVRFDVGAGFFQQGKFDLEDVRGKNVQTWGSSGRVVVHNNMPVPTSVDFMLYRNDPAKPMILFKPEKYNPNEVAWSISAEGAYLSQRLKDFDTSGEVKEQGAMAGAVQGVVKAGYLRVSATGIYRNLNFVVRNVPGFIPFETLPKSVQTDPELFGSLAADYHIASLHLTPGIGGGLQLPATFKSNFDEGGLPASRTVVVRQQGDESILPYDKDRTAVLQARVGVRWDISEMLAMNAWGQFVRDNNGTLVARDPSEGTASLRVYQSPNRIGVGLALQARF